MTKKDPKQYDFTTEMGDRISLRPPDKGYEDMGFRVQVGWAALFEFSAADLRELVSFLTDRREDKRGFASQLYDDTVYVTPPFTDDEAWEIAGLRWLFRLNETDAKKLVALIQQCVPAHH